MTKAPPEKPLPTDVKTAPGHAQGGATARRIGWRRNGRPRLTDRLAVRVLEIDPHERRAVSTTTPTARKSTPRPTPNATSSRQKKRAASRREAKDVFFLILYPRRRGPFPTGPATRQIRQWFKDVPHGIDMPESTTR